MGTTRWNDSAIIGYVRISLEMISIATGATTGLEVVSTLAFQKALLRLSSTPPTLTARETEDRPGINLKVTSSLLYAVWWSTVGPTGIDVR